MQINIHYSGELKRRLNHIINEKLERLEQFYSRIIRIDVYLKDEPDPEKDKVVEIKVSMPGPYLFAEDSSNSFEKAMAGAVDKVRKQLIKRKEAMTKHNRGFEPEIES